MTTCAACGEHFRGSGDACSRECSLSWQSVRTSQMAGDQLLHLTHHHRSHGLSCEQFESLLARAGRRCELCTAPPVPVGRVVRTSGLVIDHDHATGRVRGLLCNKCNAHMRRIDSGERVVDERTFAYLSLNLDTHGRSARP